MERNNETTYLNCLFGIAPIGCNIWHIVYSPTKGLEKTKTEPYYYRVVGNSIYCNLFWIGTYSGESNRSAASSSYSKAESSKVESSQDDDDSYEDTDSDDSDDEESSSTETFNAADYNTGITYEQLARTPNDYKGKNITLTGKVIQVVEGDDETDLRVAVDGNYDNVIMVGYDPDIMNGSRILENDKITFYAESLGTTTYKSTMGGKITVPLALAKKIDDAGTATDDYGD